MATAEELIAEQRAYVNIQFDDFSRFVDSLLDEATVSYEGVVEDLLAQHIPLDVVSNMLDAIAGTFPAVPNINIPVFSVPAVPDIAFTTLEHDITTLEAARALLLTDVQDGGYGIDPGDEAQLLDRERDRFAAEAQTAVDDLERSFTSRRFSEPPGTLFGALERIKEGVRQAVQTASRNIYIQRAQQFVQARQFAIQTAGIADRTRADILEIQFRIEEARARYTLALFESQLTHFRVQIQAALDTVTLTVRIFEAQAAVADARARVVAEKAKVFIGEYEANVRSFLGVIDVRLKNARNQLEAAVATNDGRRDAAKTGGGFFAQIVSSAMGGTNTMISQSSTDA